MPFSNALWIPTILFAVVGHVGLALPLAAETKNTHRPNILFIMADDVGSEALECYGGQSYRTPRLNQLAREGLRFEHAYSMAVCHPTRIALLSGRYPVRLGNPQWGTYPKEEESRTLAHLLANAGYATAIAGKWQLALLGDDPTHPQRLGFQESCLFGWHEGPRYYQPLIWQNGEVRSDVHDRYGPDVYCDFLIDFMTRKRDQPFFAYYPMALCHAVTNDLDKPVPVGPNGRYQNFAEMVAAMDERVGRLLDALDSAGLRERTLVLFYSDNGSPARTITGTRGDELIYEPVNSLRENVEIPGGKALLTDSGTRVPLIARWPGVVTPGGVTEDLVDVSDFLPTFAELADVPLSRDRPIDGHSFVGLLDGNAESRRSWVFAEHKDQSFVKDQRWKLYSDGRFFDMGTDAEEQHPLKPDQLGTDAQTAHLKLAKALDGLSESLVSHPEP
ncbi:MAG: sulfatase-like hydrolase/transferase [Planctomycetales bacterium]|nr:sulfatase-like hydrolase/transferase [Planctomycetales bacterium]